MGWWSCTVLGGDSPLDWHGDLCVVMGLSYDDEVTKEPQGYYGYPYTRELMNEYMAKLVDRITKSGDKNIGWQVLGAMALKVGADLSDDIKQEIVNAALNDEWANEEWEPNSGERSFYMQDLIEKILAHEAGNKTELATEYLMEKILAGK